MKDVCNRSSAVALVFGDGSKHLNINYKLVLTITQTTKTLQMSTLS